MVTPYNPPPLSRLGSDNIINHVGGDDISTLAESEEYMVNTVKDLPQNTSKVELRIVLKSDRFVPLHWGLVICWGLGFDQGREFKISRYLIQKPE